MLTIMPLCDMNAWYISCLSTYCAGRGLVLSIGAVIRGAEAPAAREDHRAGLHPMDVARQLLTNETVKEYTTFCSSVLTWLGQ